MTDDQSTTSHVVIKILAIATLHAMHSTRRSRPGQVQLDSDVTMLLLSQPTYLVRRILCCALFGFRDSALRWSLRFRHVSLSCLLHQAWATSNAEQDPRVTPAQQCPALPVHIPFNVKAAPGMRACVRWQAGTSAIGFHSHQSCTSQSLHLHKAMSTPRSTWCSCVHIIQLVCNRQRHAFP